MVVVLIRTLRLKDVIKKGKKLNQKPRCSTSPEQSLPGRSQAGTWMPEFQTSAQDSG